MLVKIFAIFGKFIQRLGVLRKIDDYRIMLVLYALANDETEYLVYSVLLSVYSASGARIRKGRTVQWTVRVRARLRRAQDGGCEASA